VIAGEEADFTATAVFSDGGTADVTEDAIWTVAPNENADVSGGALSTAQVASSYQVTIVADYTQLTSSGEITRTDARVILVSVSNASGGCGAGIMPFLALLTVSAAIHNFWRAYGRP
jgi:hypothetical protein